MNSAIILLLSLAIDRVFGEPPDIFHPTVYIGKAIEKLKFLERYGSAGGIFIVAMVTCLSISIFLLLIHLQGYAKLLLSIYILKSSFSWRGLRDYTLPVGDALKSGVLERARKLLVYVVSRPTEKLDESEASSACVESIGENIHDSMLSPLFYFALFSCLSPEAGVAAAFFYRVMNTLDSMIGYRKYGSFGMPSAKLDDILNYIPARVSALLIILFSSEKIRTLKTVLKYGSATESPNAGIPMAAMAGATGVKLTKKGSYVLGEGRDAVPEDIDKAIAISDRVIFFFALVIFLLLLIICTPF
ncbi:cobalamin biosynthesis protein [archaeon]|nr:cobalamin biosynthesis protein [archaeon]